MSSSGSLPLVSVIVLNWNGWQDTIECIDSLYRITYPNYEIVLVDNCSTDDSVARIIEYYGPGVRIESKNADPTDEYSIVIVFDFKGERFNATRRQMTTRELDGTTSKGKMWLIENRKNFGYAGGNNIGMRFAFRELDPRYILILNNDTVVDPDFLGNLVTRLESDAGIGVTSPLVYDYHNHDLLRFSGNGRINLLRGQSVEDTTPHLYSLNNIHCLTGCCYLISRTAIERVGLMDPTLFLYWEEADWSVRLLRHGYSIDCARSARIWHKGGSSTKKSIQPAFYYSTRNRFIFMRKYANRIQLFSFIFSFLLFDSPLVLGSVLLRRRNPRLLMIYLGAVLDGARGI